jgi:hypothetical protein
MAFIQHLKISEFTFFSNASGTCIKINIIYWVAKCLNKFQKVAVLQGMFSNQKELNYKSITYDIMKSIKAVLIKSASYPRPSLRTAQIFFHLRIYKLIFKQRDQWFCASWQEPTASLGAFYLFFLKLFLSFPLNKVLLLFCSLCLCPVLCSGDRRTWELEIFWTSVLLDHPGCSIFRSRNPW